MTASGRTVQLLAVAFPPGSGDATNLCPVQEDVPDVQGLSEAGLDLVQGDSSSTGSRTMDKTTPRTVAMTIWARNTADRVSGVFEDSLTAAS